VPESHFQTPTLLLFQNFRIWVRIQLIFKFKNPNPVQTPAASIDLTEIYLCFHLRNEHTDSCSAKIEKWLQIGFSQIFDSGSEREKAESCRSRLRHSGSMTTSVDRADVCMDWILDQDSGYFRQDQEWGFLFCSRIKIGFRLCVY